MTVRSVLKRLNSAAPFPRAALYRPAVFLAIEMSENVSELGLADGPRGMQQAELLTLAKGQGFFKDSRNVDHMQKDTDLDPLRAREDFRQLIGKLTGVTKE
jgi:hypothetical protein